MNEESLFAAALAKTGPAERLAFLDEACAGDAALRQRLERLLAADEHTNGILERGPDPGTPDDPPPEEPSAAVGPYQLIEPIGEGGMGAVWLAQQTEPVKRLVAVKLIKPGMDSKQVIARFEAERQALALMDHANIARVLDAGTTATGRPYFVMDLVRGVPITKYCDDNRLTPRQRLELFIPVCRAVQHAHQKGVIHRDLKPSNVLVAPYDGRPVPKVIDFGIAKAAGQSLTEKTLVTGFGNIVGTPEYMSPEKAELNNQDIDTRSDVYSLGVLLYELLTGSPPFTRRELGAGGVLEMLRVIREQEPTKPSAKLSTAEGLPALAANRGTEPAKLAKLVKGELDWIVMKALEKDRGRRYETANGLAMDVQRYLADEPVLACPPSAGYRLRKFARRNKGGLAVAALVLCFLVLLGSGIGWAVRDRAARQANVAGQVESIFAEVNRLEGQQKWAEALAAARRAEAAAAGGEADAPTAQRVRQRLKGLEFIDRLEQIRMQRATWLEGKFDNAGADREYARAFRHYGVDVEELPVETSIDRLKARPALAIALAAALDEWVYARREVAKKDAAGWKRLVAIARGIDPEPLRDRLRALWGRPASETRHELRRLAGLIDIPAQHPATLVSLASTLRRVNHSEAALRLLRGAQHVYPGDFWLNFKLAFALLEQKDYEGAIRFYTAAVSIRPRAAAAHNDLGVALHGQKKLDEAIACYRKAIALEPKHAFAYGNLGNALVRQNKWDKALAAYRKAAGLGLRDAKAYYNLGFALHRQKRLDAAVAAFRKAVALDPKYALAYENLGSALHDQKKLDAAVAAFRKAVALEPKRVAAHYNLGNALLDQNQLDEAIAAYRKAIALDPKLADAHTNLGCALSDQKKWGEAIAAYQKAIELDPTDAQVYNNLGTALRAQKKLDEAIAAYRKAIALNPQNAGPHNNLGALLCDDRKEYDKAIECFRMALELDPKFVNAYVGLGNALDHQGKLEEASDALRKAIALDPKDANASSCLASVLSHQKKWDQAVAAYKKALAIDPQHANAPNAFAWLLATCPDARFRDPRQAVALAKKAIGLDPKNPLYSNTLGVALYRAGNWKAAIAALDKSVERRQGGDSFDWFFLAMAHWRLGRKDKARQWYDRAVQWMDRHQRTNEELDRFRAEAAQLLGMEKKKS
jgi:tetratricopeptide (TPR) repeat protein